MNDQFSVAEYQHRWRRAQEAMRRHGLDALFVTAETNVVYFSGHRPVVPWDTTTRATFCLLPANGAPMLIVHDVWAGGARADSPIAAIRSYPETMTLPEAALVAALRETGLLHGRIGAELGFEQRMGLAPNDYAQLVRATPGVTWVDGAAALWEVRMIKSAEEVETIRHACRINMRAFNEAYSRITPQTTERELAAALRASIAQQGGEFGFMAPCLTPAAYTTYSRMPGPQRLEPGRLIWCDMGARWNFYWSDFSRAAVLGKATAQQQRLWTAVHEVTQAGVAAIGPGVAPSEVVAACEQTAQRLGVAMNFASGRIGHGLGLMLTEPPHIAGYATEPLQPGMVITVEPGIVCDDGVYIVEQNVLVTETGREQLSPNEWEIQEID